MSLKKYLMPLLIAATFFTACKTKKSTSENVTYTETKTILAEKLAHENDSNLTFYDWNEGYAKAMRINKILLVDIYTDWCHYCKVMDLQTYSNQQIINQLNQHFVCVKFNPEKARTDFVFDTTTIDQRMLASFLMDRRSSGYPTTTFWLNPGNKERLEIYPGYKEPNVFSAILTNLVSHRFGNSETPE